MVLVHAAMGAAQAMQNSRKKAFTGCGAMRGRRFGSAQPPQKRALWAYASRTLVEITLRQKIFAGDADFVIFARFIAVANC